MLRRRFIRRLKYRLVIIKQINDGNDIAPVHIAMESISNRRKKFQRLFTATLFIQRFEHLFPANAASSQSDYTTSESESGFDLLVFDEVKTESPGH